MPKSCGRNDDCGPDQICHPLGQVCMKTCNDKADCPQWLDTCAEIRDPNGGGRTPRVCQCSSATVCNSIGGDFTCHPTDNLCERLCSRAEDCGMFQPPRLCEPVSGLCLNPGSSCASNLNCPSPAEPRCDLASRRCMGCLGSVDCASRPDGLTQCSPDGSCVPPS
jgi:hypothetical protein